MQRRIKNELTKWLPDPALIMMKKLYERKNPVISFEHKKFQLIMATLCARVTAR